MWLNLADLGQVRWSLVVNRDSERINLCNSIYCLIPSVVIRYMVVTLSRDLESILVSVIKV